MYRRIALAVGGVLVALALVEVLLRLSGGIPEAANPLHSFHTSDPILGWRGKPEVKKRFRRPDFDALVVHDADGWRLPDPAPPADPVRRVLVLGDSFTWGWGVSQGELFTDHLQRALPNAAVINRGVNAYGTGQQYLVLQRELAVHHYDMVVLMFFFNDVGDNEDGHSGRRPLFTVAKGQLSGPQPPTRLMRGKFQTWLKDHSRAFQLADYAFGALKHRPGEPPPPAEASPDAAEIDYASLPGAAVTERLVQAMAEACKARGAGFIVVYVPHRSELGGLRTLPAVRAVHTLARDAAMVSGAPFIDLTPAFAEALQRGDVVVFPHDQHWTPSGHALAARTLLATGLFSAARQPDPLLSPRRRRQAGAGSVGNSRDRANDGDRVGSGVADGAGGIDQRLDPDAVSP